MADRPIERDFAEYRATKSAPALAAVFDATAPELLLVAVHLVGDRVEAEDLVQATFVEVIESAERWDRSRPLMPWLVGILANRAKLVIRRRRRRPESSRLNEPSSADPALAAEASEVADQVSGALAGLPANYRHVLVLHLVHGLQGVQIAQSLGKPPATIRTQIKRGLEMLRGALPAALAVPASLLAAEGRGLAAVRAAVLDTVAVPGIATSTLVGGVLVAKKLAISGGVLALVFLAWLGFRGGEDAPAVQPQPTASVVAERVAAAAPVVEPTPEPERTEAAPARATASRSTATVRGRCLAPDGSALVDCSVHLSGRSQSRPVEVGHGASGSDGRFALEVEPEGLSRLFLSIDQSGYLPLNGRIEALVPGAAVDLGDLRLLRGSALIARVVDERQEPVPGVRARIEVDVPTFDGSQVSQLRGGVSDVDGHVEIAGRLPAGSWRIRIDEAFALVEPKTLVVPPDRDVTYVDFVVKRRTAVETLTGRVVDELGEPVANLAVFPESKTVGGYVESPARSGHDGSFVVYRRPEHDDSVRLRADGTDQWLPALSDFVRWGTTDLELVVRPAGVLELEVVEARSGAPVEDYGIVFAWSEDRKVTGRVRHEGHHDGGILRVPGIGRGGYLRLLVIPSGDDYGLSERVRIELPESGSTSARVAVQRQRMLSVVVRDTEDRPVAGSKIELIQLLRDQRLRERTTALVREGVVWNFRTRDDDWPLPWLRDVETTDLQGRAQLRCPPEIADVGLRVWGSHAPLIVQPLELPPVSESLELVVTAGATLTGSMTPTGFADRFTLEPGRTDLSEPAVGLALRRPGSKHPELPQGAVSTYQIARDGSFSIAGVPPGAWEIMLFWWRPTSPRTNDAVVLEPPLATVDVAAGETKRLELDVSAFLPASIRGRVLRGGRPLADATVSFTSQRTARRSVEVGGIGTDADGRFELSGIAAGRYHLLAHVGEASLHTDHWISVSAGQNLERDFEVAARTVRIAFTERDEPLRNRPVTVLHDGFRWAWTLLTDARGGVTLPDAPRGELRVFVHAEDAVLDKQDDYLEALERDGVELAPILVELGEGVLEVRR